jgi:hypothetical protein
MHHLPAPLPSFISLCRNILCSSDPTGTVHIPAAFHLQFFCFDPPNPATPSNFSTDFVLYPSTLALPCACCSTSDNNAYVVLMCLCVNVAWFSVIMAG